MPRPNGRTGPAPRPVFCDRPGCHSVLDPFRARRYCGSPCKSASDRARLNPPRPRFCALADCCNLVAWSGSYVRFCGDDCRKRHISREYRARGRVARRGADRPPPTMACVFCGRETASSDRWGRKRFCSRRCTRKAEQIVHSGGACRVCGERIDLSEHRVDTQLCSDACRLMEAGFEERLARIAKLPPGPPDEDPYRIELDLLDCLRQSPGRMDRRLWHRVRARSEAADGRHWLRSRKQIMALPIDARTASSEDGWMFVEYDPRKLARWLTDRGYAGNLWGIDLGTAPRSYRVRMAGRHAV